VSVNSTIDLYEGSSLKARRDASQRDQRLTFSHARTVSSELTIFRVTIGQYDRIDVSLKFEVDVKDCTDFRVKYQFTDPASEQLIRIIRVVLAACVLYAFVTFLFSVGKDLMSQNYVLPIILGISAVSATNPLGVALSSIEWFTPITMMIFLSVHRFFSLIMLRKRGGKLNESWVTGAAMIAALYGIVEGIATIPSSFAGSFKAEVNAFHLGYAVLVVALFSYALRTYSQVQRFQAIGFGVFTLVAAGMTILSEVFVKGQDREASTMSLLLYQSSHLLSAIVFLFFENGAAIGYEKLRVAPLTDAGDLDVEKDTGQANQVLE
jgi:hypothetical protein